jgi:hypothetical protein
VFLVRQQSLPCHPCVPGTTKNLLYPLLCTWYGSKISLAILVFLVRQLILPYLSCVPVMAVRSPLPSSCSWYNSKVPLALLCSWHGSKVSPAILVFLVRQQSFPRSLVFRHGSKFSPAILVWQWSLSWPRCVPGMTKFFPTSLVVSGRQLSPSCHSRVAGMGVNSLLSSCCWYSGKNIF